VLVARKEKFSCDLFLKARKEKSHQKIIVKKIVIKYSVNLLLFINMLLTTAVCIPFKVP
jgi:hypothetical protein